jgi:hypothetical protein
MCICLAVITANTCVQHRPELHTALRPIRSLVVLPYEERIASLTQRKPIPLVSVSERLFATLCSAFVCKGVTTSSTTANLVAATADTTSQLVNYVDVCRCLTDAAAHYSLCCRCYLCAQRSLLELSSCA